MASESTIPWFFLFDGNPFRYVAYNQLQPSDIGCITMVVCNLLCLCQDAWLYIIWICKNETRNILLHSHTYHQQSAINNYLSIIYKRKRPFIEIKCPLLLLQFHSSVIFLLYRLTDWLSEFIILFTKPLVECHLINNDGQSPVIITHNLYWRILQ